VGRNPQAVARFVAGDPRIECTGPPADALAEIARATVAVVPVLAGSGTRFKIIEAWAAGVPVVSTRIGAEGLPASDGANILLADDPAAFAQAVGRLLCDRCLWEQIRCTARDVFERQLTWRTAWSQLEI
jgi:polysaccharide biosynthesis protein PslH